jgi:hypothetical protein
MSSYDKSYSLRSRKKVFTWSKATLFLGRGTMGSSRKKTGRDRIPHLAVQVGHLLIRMTAIARKSCHRECEPRIPESADTLSLSLFPNWRRSQPGTRLSIPLLPLPSCGVPVILVRFPSTEAARQLTDESIRSCRK